MAGYLLIEEKYLLSAKPYGFSANPDPIGILDYLRELRQESFPFNDGKRLRIVGLEDLLIAAGEKQKRSRRLHSPNTRQQSQRVELYSGHECPGHFSAPSLPRG
jgi:hypothetical protein